jgi:hypothetical protein
LKKNSRSVEAAIGLNPSAYHRYGGRKKETPYVCGFLFPRTDVVCAVLRVTFVFGARITSVKV